MKVTIVDFHKGSVDQKVLRSVPEDLIAEDRSQPVAQPVAKPTGKMDPKRINESKLPDAIKQAMIDNPIPQIGLNDSLDMNFVAKTRKLMELDGTMPASDNQPIQEEVHPTQVQTRPKAQPKTAKITAGDLERRLTPIIENVVRKTLDEIFDRKLTQLLAAQGGTTINENLAIKVGDTIFTGKITKSKSSK